MPKQLKVSAPCRILLLRKRLHGSACHILTRVHSHRERGSFCQLQYSHPTISASADASSRQAKNSVWCAYSMQRLCMCSTDGWRFIMLWEENQHREPARAPIVNKDAYHLCAFPKQHEQLCILVCQQGCQYLFLTVITRFLLQCFFNKPQGFIHKVRQIRNWKHLFSPLRISSRASQVVSRVWTKMHTVLYVPALKSSSLNSWNKHRYFSFNLEH